MIQLRYVISILEAIYLIFMCCRFQTTWSFQNPWESMLLKSANRSWLTHTLHRDIYDNKVCTLGKIISIIVAIWFVLRHWISIPYESWVTWLLVLGFWIGGFVLNWNIFVYLLPIVFIEYMWQCC